MKLEDLGKAIPETPDFIHQMIMEEVQKQTSGESKGEHKIVPMGICINSF